MENNAKVRSFFFLFYVCVCLFLFGLDVIIYLNIFTNEVQSFLKIVSERCEITATVKNYILIFRLEPSRRINQKPGFKSHPALLAVKPGVG